MTKEKNSRKLKRHADRVKAPERRAKIRQMIEDIGLWNIPKTQLSTEFKVSQSMITIDIREVIKNIPEEKLVEPTVEFAASYRKAIKELRKILADPSSTKDEKIKAAHALNKVIESFTKFYESFGIKEIRDSPLIQANFQQNITSISYVQLSKNMKAAEEKFKKNNKIYLKKIEGINEDTKP